MLTPGAKAEGKSHDDAVTIDDDDVPADAPQQPLLGSEPPPESSSKSGIIDGLVTLICCVAYLLVGPALIIVNKQILKDIGFAYPMLVSGIGQFASAVGSAVAIHVLNVQQLQHAVVMTRRFYMRNMMTVGAATAASLCFGNAGYLFLTVSFVQILKAFTPVFVVVMLYCSGIESPSLRVSASVALICVGTAIASAGEANFSAMGLAIMFCAETCEAGRLVLTQKLLTNMKFSALEGLYWMSPICCFWMWGLALGLEAPALVRANDLQLIVAHPSHFASAAFLGLAVNLASMFVIKRTSSVMLKVMGTARNAGLVLFSAIFLNESITPTQTVGYVICLAAFALYNYYKVLKL